MSIRDRKANGGQGMNWIKPAKRLAIYLRDGLACGYCGEGIEDGAKLTLDHLTPHSKGGSNDAMNLLTCCHSCNSKRGNRSVTVFAATVAANLNHGLTLKQLLSDIKAATKRPLRLELAKELIAARGGFVAACKSAAALNLNSKLV